MHATGTWGCAMYCPDDTGDEGKASALRVSETLGGATLRQIIRASAGGDKLRLAFSNEYGESDMQLQSVRLAKAAVPACSDIHLSTDTAVTFGGRQSAAIPAGSICTSDTLSFKILPLERLAVSVYFGDMPGCVSCHVGARANSFIKPGNAVSDRCFEGAGVSVCTHWFALSGADIVTSGRQQTERRSIIAFGDSITDGFGVTDERYTRWTDILAEKLQADKRTRHLPVINMGIGTNRLLEQENPPAGLKRFERDVLRQPGAGYFVCFIGVNDLAFSEASAEKLIAGYEQMFRAASANGIKTCACTVLPYAKEDPRRHAINNQMREWHRQGMIDMLIDFDALLKDPDNPDIMRREYDNDGIHPTGAAYKAMGEHAFDIIKNSFKEL